MHRWCFGEHEKKPLIKSRALAFTYVQGNILIMGSWCWSCSMSSVFFSLSKQQKQIYWNRKLIATTANKAEHPSHIPKEEMTFFIKSFKNRSCLVFSERSIWDYQKYVLPIFVPTYNQYSTQTHNANENSECYQCANVCTKVCSSRHLICGAWWRIDFNFPFRETLIQLTFLACEYTEMKENIEGTLSIK